MINWFETRGHGYLYANIYNAQRYLPKSNFSIISPSQNVEDFSFSLFQQRDCNNEIEYIVLSAWVAREFQLENFSMSCTFSQFNPEEFDILLSLIEEYNDVIIKEKIKALKKEGEYLKDTNNNYRFHVEHFDNKDIFELKSFLKNLGDRGEVLGNKLKFSISLPAVPSQLEKEQKTLLEKLIFDDSAFSNPYITTEKEMLDFLQPLVINYIKELPFPWNTRCLSEILILNALYNKEKNPWESGYWQQQKYKDSILFVVSTLKNCNRKAFEENKLTHIAPEVAVILSQPHFKSYISDLLHLFLEEELSSESKAFAQKEGAKEIVCDFGNAVLKVILDEENKKNYRDEFKSPKMQEFFSIKTRSEQLNDSMKAIRNMFHWMSPLNHRKTSKISPQSLEENTGIMDNACYVIKYKM